MKPFPSPTALRRVAGAIALATAAMAATAATAAPPVEPMRAIEQAMAAAQQDKRGVTLYVAGQAISGAVTHIEPGQWVALRHVQHGRIVVRLDRIDAVATP